MIWMFSVESESWPFWILPSSFGSLLLAMNLNLDLPDYSSLNLNSYLLLSTVAIFESLNKSCLLWLNHWLMLSTVAISKSLTESCLPWLNHWLMLSTVEISESLVESCLPWLNPQFVLSATTISESAFTILRSAQICCSSNKSLLSGFCLLSYTLFLFNPFWTTQIYTLFLLPVWKFNNKIVYYFYLFLLHSLHFYDLFSHLKSARMCYQV